jgi:SAM-dependent methyltransferase
VSQPRLYGELAEWFHVLTEPMHYEEEARIFAEAIEQTTTRPVRTMLELGSGGGNNASHLKKRYELTLTDLSPQMLDASRALNPECEHIEGDMRSLRLGRRFDAVFVHDAVAYLLTETDLEACMRTAREHLEPGGVALFVPDDTAENYDPRASAGGNDAGDRALRYLEWPRSPVGTTVDITFVYVLRDGDSERIEVDHHLVGLFPRAMWLSLLENVGFEPQVLPFRHSEFSAGEKHELFIGLKR